jgi:undecaprenyl-diphosphatase
VQTARPESRVRRRRTAFFSVAVEEVPVTPLSSIDDVLVQWIATHRWPPLNDPSIWLGDLDRVGAVWVGLVLVVGALRGLGMPKTLGLALLTATTTFLADSASFGVKDLVHRPRPFEAHHEIHPLYTVHSSSFPAGHAATSFAGATLLAYLAPRGRLLFFALAVAIGFSRVYVGVHYPGDVLGGAAIGAVVALAAIAVLRLSGEPRVREALRSRWSLRASPRP